MLNGYCSTEQVAIVGGSLGGLAAAAALRNEADADVTVFERSPCLTGTEGAGLWVQPEFKHFLESNGIATKETFGVSPERVAIYDSKGNQIFRSRSGGVATSWDTLFRSFRSAIPDECYRAGREVDAEATVAVAAFPGLPRHLARRKLMNTNGTDAAYTEESEAVTLCFADGSSEQFDAIIFCDGAASGGRKALNTSVGVREEAVSAWAGYWVWRAMVDETDIMEQLPEVWEEIMSQHCWYFLRQAEGRYQAGGPLPPHVEDPSLPGTGHFLMYPVPGVKGELEPGKRRVMWEWYVVPGVEDPLATFEEVMLDVHGVQNSVGVARGAVRPVIVERLKQIATKVRRAALKLCTVVAFLSK
jgi:2-polyprenyl-6-methoxyphenol hydroxylase-like FAD-dependent oxidoreductase